MLAKYILFLAGANSSLINNKICGEYVRVELQMIVKDGRKVHVW